MSMISAANPTANSINPAAPINGTAQGMPTPKAFGTYTPGRDTNVLGSWGRKARTGGIPGDGAYAPQGAPSSSAGNFTASSTPASSASGSSSTTSSSSGTKQLAGLYGSNGYGNSSTQAFADGGDVEGNTDQNSEVASGDNSNATAAIPSDVAPSSNGNNSSGGSPQSGQSDGAALMQSVYNTLTYGRQKNGLTNEIVHQAFNTDGMRASSNVEDNRQGAGSIDTGQPVTKADANQALPNINGSSSGPAAPWPYNGSGTVLTAIPTDNSQAPAMKKGGAIPEEDED